MAEIFDRPLPWTETDLNEINCDGRACECDRCDTLATQALSTRVDMNTPPHVYGRVMRYYCQYHFDVALAEEKNRYP